MILASTCCHLDYYMKESYHNGFKVMFIHIAIFLLLGLLQFAVNKFFMFFFIFFSSIKYGGL